MGKKRTFKRKNIPLESIDLIPEDMPTTPCDFCVNEEECQESNEDCDVSNEFWVFHEEYGEKLRKLVEKLKSIS